MPTDRFKQIERASAGIRRRVLEHTLKNNGGYVSQACSSAEIFSCLYLDLMKMTQLEKPLRPGKYAGVPGPDNPSYKTGNYFHGEISPAHDRFFMSPSQYALVLYAALIEVDRLYEGALNEFNQDGSSVEMIGAEHSPGLECMSGSLGQGLSQAAGIAWARKHKKEEGHVWVFMSDGEFQAGQTWEAIQTLVQFGIDNITVLVDVNGQQCDGTTDSVISLEGLHKRAESFGAAAFSVDGHDNHEICRIGKWTFKNRPLFLFCKTDPIREISILQDNFPKLHYLRFKSDEEKSRYAKILRKMEAMD